MSPSNAVWPGLVGMFGVPFFGVWAHQIKSWRPVILGVFILVLAGVLSFHKSKLIKVNVPKAMRLHWYAFFILVIVLLWFIYDGFFK